MKSNLIILTVDNNKKYIRKCLNAIAAFKHTSNLVDTDIMILVPQDWKYQYVINNIFPDVLVEYIDNNKLNFRTSNVRYSTAVYYRLLIFKLQNIRKYNRVMFVDCDIDVFKDVHDIFQYKLGEDAFIGVVYEGGSQYLCVDRLKKSLLIQKYKELNFENGYFNAGMLLIDMNIMLRLCNPDDIYNELIEILQTNVGIDLNDQGALNTLFSTAKYKNFIYPMPAIFNLTGVTKRNSTKEYHWCDAYIIHYINGKEYPMDKYPQSQEIDRTLANKIDVSKLPIMQNCYVISNNSKKLERMFKQFDYFNIPRPTVFKPTGSCEQSHLDIIKMAKEKNLPYITIFEDDAYPLTDTIDKLENIQNCLNEHWDEIGIVQLGRLFKQYWGNPNVNEKIFDMFVINRTTIPGAYAYFIKNSSYDDRIASITTMSITRGFDYMSGKMKYNFADRFSQEHFHKLALAVIDPAFAHRDIIKRYDAGFAKGFIGFDELTAHTTRQTLTLDELLQHSFVITIDNEQYNRFVQTFKYHHIDILPKKFDGFMVSSIKCNSQNIKGDVPQKFLPIINCTYSHISIVKLAKILDWPFVCIFEDDAYPCNDIKTKLDKYMKDIPTDVECLSLGNIGFRKFYTHPIDKRYTKFKCNYGSHAYIVFKSGYDSYIDATTKGNALADEIFSSIDNMYAIQENLFLQANMTNHAMNGHTREICSPFTQEQTELWFPEISCVLSNQHDM